MVFVLQMDEMAQGGAVVRMQSRGSRDRRGYMV